MRTLPTLTRPGATLAPIPYATRPADVVRMRDAGLVPQTNAPGRFVPFSALRS